MSKPQFLDMYVAFGKRRGNDTLHWILVLAPPDSNRCTWYHVKGGPTQGVEYRMKVEDNKRLDSFGIASLYKISTIPVSQRRRVLASANAVPLQRCQRWTTELLMDLERKGLVPPGTGAHFAAQIEPSRYEQGHCVQSSGGFSGSMRASGSGSSGSGSSSRGRNSRGMAGYPSGSSSRSLGSSGSWAGRRV